MTAIAYTDASFDHRLDIATCGFVVIAKNKELTRQVHIVGEIGTIQNAEIYSVVQAIQYCFLIKNIDTIVIKTDHIAIITRKKKSISYQELDETIEMCKESGIEVVISHVRAHNGNRYNTIIDGCCNKALKKYIDGEKKETPGIKRRA